MRKSGLMLGIFTCSLYLVGLASGQIGLQGGRQGGEGRVDPLQMLNNASVKKELELTDEQTQKIPDAVLKALGDVLNEKQLKRLKQIELQQRGTAAFIDAKVQDSLKLTAEQTANIKTIVDDSRKELREAFQGGGGFKGGAEKIENLRKETMEKITGVMSSDQKKSWKQMTGDTFKMERPAFGGFGDNKKRTEKKTE